MNLNDLMAQVGWTSAELAWRLNVAPNSVDKWRCGRRTPPNAVLAWLAHVAECQAGAGSAPPGWFSADREAAE
jgi:transcriptional regulator with XRE-family HTH domain